MITKKCISKIELSDGFFDISYELGFTIQELEAYNPLIKSLMKGWSKNGFIEIYELSNERKYGRIKSTGRLTAPLYVGIYHGRVSDKNDPLFIISFEEGFYFKTNNRFVATIKFIINHDDIFGKMGEEKKNKIKMLKKQNFVKKLSEKHKFSFSSRTIFSISHFKYIFIRNAYFKKPPFLYCFKNCCVKRVFL